MDDGPSQRALVAAKIATLPKGANQPASIEAPSQEEAVELSNESRFGFIPYRKQAVMR